MAVREPLIVSCVADKVFAGDQSVLAPWWSIAKTAIAACALVLVADGRLDLDRTMPGRRFTLRQLLQHTSGLPCYTESDAYEVAVERHDDRPLRRNARERPLDHARRCSGPHPAQTLRHVGRHRSGRAPARR